MKRLVLINHFNWQSLGIQNAKISDLEDVRLVTFGSVSSEKFCFILSGAVKHISEFKFSDHRTAFNAGFHYLRNGEQS